MRQVLFLVCVLFARAAHAASSTWLLEETRHMHPITGTFTDRDYGFSVEAPAAASEYVTDGGDGNNGVIIVLGEHRTIVVYPVYTGFVEGDDTPCGSQQLPWRKTSTSLTGIGRIGRQVACVVTQTEGDVIRRIMQVAGDDRGTGIMYSLVVTTNRPHSRTDLIAFKEVADTFRRVTIYP
jgi:hypothetical protein